MAATTNASFNELARDAGLTPGNLQSHVKALEAAGYVEAWRSLVDLKPRMRYRLTDGGRRALKRYCEGLARIIQDVDALQVGDPDRR